MFISLLNIGKGTLWPWCWG